METSLVMAFGLMLVVEGVMPLIAPKLWRETFQRMVTMKDGQLRFVGMASMLCGMVVVLMAG